MEPKKRTRTTPATATATTPMIDAAITALISQGVADALVEHEIQRNNNLNDDRSQGSRIGITRPVRPTRECTYTNFLKCQPMNFKGTKGAVGLTQWRKFLEESNKIKKYVGGLPDVIHESVMASKPKTIENKRKQDDNQQQPPKKQDVAIAYTVGPGERKEYAGTLSLCNKCKFHHNGQYTVKCANCKRVGHLTQDCRSPAVTNNQRNLTFYECRNQGHYRSDFSELKN
nr:reverse transcriptase domain-containing protein [Tanacetum cinerariifolium]GFA01090.1 reverse transcriptase domain-containing protein [Tanacetum cinerariifolium]